MPKNDFDKRAAERVVTLTEDHPTEDASGLRFALPDEARGISIMKDDADTLYLVRMSKDGWAQAYLMSDARGPLKAKRAAPRSVKRQRATQ